MSEQADNREDLGEDYEFPGQRGLPPLRLRQLRLQAQSQLADAQREMARSTVRIAYYTFWAAMACAVSSVTTVGAVLYGIFVVLPRVAH